MTLAPTTPTPDTLPPLSERRTAPLLNAQEAALSASFERELRTRQARSRQDAIPLPEGDKADKPAAASQSTKPTSDKTSSGDDAAEADPAASEIAASLPLPASLADAATPLEAAMVVMLARHADQPTTIRGLNRELLVNSGAAERGKDQPSPTPDDRANTPRTGRSRPPETGFGDQGSPKVTDSDKSSTTVNQGQESAASVEGKKHAQPAPPDAKPDAARQQEPNVAKTAPPIGRDARTPEAAVRPFQAPPQRPGSAVSPSAAGRPVTAISAGAPARAAATGPAAAASTAPARRNEPSAFAAQLERGLQAAISQAKDGRGEITLRLQPHNLGRLKVTVAFDPKADNLTARFEVASQDVRRLVGDSLQGLRESLEARGLNVERLDVALAERLPSRADPLGLVSGTPYAEQAADGHGGSGTGQLANVPAPGGEPGGTGPWMGQGGRGQDAPAWAQRMPGSTDAPDTSLDPAGAEMHAIAGQVGIYTIGRDEGGAPRLAIDAIA